MLIYINVPRQHIKFKFSKVKKKSKSLFKVFLDNNTLFVTKLCCLTHLEGINISKSVLHMAVHHQLTETQHLSA